MGLAEWGGPYVSCSPSNVAVVGMTVLYPYQEAWPAAY